MTTTIRTSISQRNKYYISKHRFLELKHFCLQYPEWKEEYYREFTGRSRSIISIANNSDNLDETAEYAIRRAILSRNMKVVEQSAIEADPDIADYILLAVTNGCSFEFLKTKQGIPCCRETYYDRYRRFFWVLDRRRE